MTASLRWKLVAAFALVFLAGLACGYFGGVRHAFGIFAHPRPSYTEHMTRALQRMGVNSQQMEQAKPIIDRAAKDLDAVRGKTSQDVTEIFDRSQRELNAILTPEQQKKFEEMRERWRQMRRRGMKPPRPADAPAT